MTPPHLLISTLYHRLRGPLSNIIGHAHLLELHEAATLSESGKDRVAKIVGLARDLSGTVEEIIALFKAELDRTNVETGRQLVDLLALLNDVAAIADKYSDEDTPDRGQLTE